MFRFKLFRARFFLFLAVMCFGMSQEVIVQDHFSEKFEEMTRRKKMRRQLYSIPQEQYLIDLIGHVTRSLSIVAPSYKAISTRKVRKSYFGKESLIDDTIADSLDVEERIQCIRESLLGFMNEWETAEVVEFQLQEGRMAGYQKKILKIVSQNDRLEISKDLFRLGLERFNEGNYESAVMIMENLLSTYKFIRKKNRVNYFIGLSYYYLSRYNEAISVLEKVLRSSESDRLIALALVKMYIVKNNLSAVLKIEKKFPSLSTTRNLSDLFYFVVGRYYISIQEFAQTIRVLKKISPDYRLYKDSRLFYASALYKQSKEEGRRAFRELADELGATSDIRNESYLRLAYIDYQEKKYSDALLKLNQINSDDCYAYDRILVAKAWCYYEIGSFDSKNQVKNFSKSISLLNTVVNEFLNSVYYNEAKSLLGYVKQRMGNIMGAENDFLYAFESKSFKIYSDRFLMERDSLLRVKNKVLDLEERSLLENDHPSLSRLDDIGFNIDRKLYRLKYMDFSSVYPNVAVDLKIVYEQINEFERLKKIAEKGKDVELVKRIDGDLLRLYSAVNQYRRLRATSLFGVNYFKDYRLARKVSMVAYGVNKYSSLEKKSMRRYNQTLSQINELEEQKNEAIENDGSKKVVVTDVALYRLKKISKKTDYLNSIASAHIETALGDNIDKWANYGAYQLTNIQYLQKQKIAKENRDNEFTVKKISKLMDNRNTYLAEQIKRIENNIYVMVRREAKRRRIEEREKTKSFYKVEFFDERKSEVNEDSIRNELERKAYERRLLRNKVNKTFGLMADTLLNVDTLFLKSGIPSDIDTLLNNTDTIPDVNQIDSETEESDTPSEEKIKDDLKNKASSLKEED